MMFTDTSYFLVLLLLREAQFLMMMNSNDNSSNSAMNPVTKLVTAADPQATNTPIEVTQFVDDGAMQAASLPAPVVPSVDVLASGLESRRHEILDILQRPVRLDNYNWTTSLNPNDELVTAFNFPNDFLDKAPNVVSKINHFLFLRAHVVIRFVLNCNTFQAGRLIAYFAPYSSQVDIGDRTLNNNYLAAKSIFPRIILDAGSGNSGELTIPYVSFLTHYNIPQAMGDLGTISVSVLNKLSTGDATLTLFARFTNISLEFPTAAQGNLGSFASLFADIMHFTANEKCDAKCLRKKVMASARNVIRAQVGEAEEKASKGVLSSTLHKVSGMASLGSSLPVIGQYLTPVAWVTKAAAVTANFLGFSKSTNLESTNKLASIPGYGFTNVDGSDNSVILGTSVENEIGSRSDLFGSSLDEMDIPYVVKHESFLGSFQWNSLAVPGDILESFGVGPGALATNVSSLPVFDSTALGYVASIFRYWRGGIKYKIQVTKTAYHSGRIRISFVPGGTVGGTGYDFNQGYSEIVDLRTSDEVEFVVPYASNTIWKPVDLVDYVNPARGQGLTGVIIIEVINALRAPPSVESVVDCNIWVSGGDDMQFAIPDFMEYVPVAYTAPVRAQVLGNFQDEGFNPALSSDVEMFNVPKTSAVDANALCIGEHVQNLRPLLRRFGTAFTGSVADTDYFKINTGYFGPFATSSSPLTEHSITPLDYISHLYRFYRGSTRYKGVIQPTAFGEQIIAVSDPGVFAPVAVPGTATITTPSRLTQILARGGAFMHIINTIYNRVLEITCPYFSNTHISLVRGLTAAHGPDQDRNTDLYLKGSGTVELELLKAAGDDFSFGWLVGPPRLMKRPPASPLVSINTATIIDLSNLVDGFCISEPLSGTNTQSGGILYSEKPSFILSYTNATFEVVFLTSCRVNYAFATPRFEFPYNVDLVIDVTATLQTINALGTFNIAVTP